MRRIGAMGLGLGMALASAAAAQGAVGGVYLSAGRLAPRDAVYRSVYGGGTFFPEATARVLVLRPVYIWGGFGLSWDSGATTPGRLPSKSRQTWFSGGIGTQFWMGRSVTVLMEAGATDVAYREEALGVVVRQSALGFRAGAGLYVKIGPVAPGIEADYLAVSDTFEGQPVKLGGFRAAFAVGFLF